MRANEATSKIEPLFMSAPRTVLLAEDDEDTRNKLATELRKDGYRVVELEDGMELVDYVEEAFAHPGKLAQPDVIVSEVAMPGCGGLEACERLHQIDQTTPVILLSAIDDFDTYEEADRVGAACVLTRPFNLDDLRDAVWSVASG